MPQSCGIPAVLDCFPKFLETRFWAGPLYFFYDGKRIVLTNGFVKKTPKTPAAEIAAAKKYHADFLSRKEKSDG
ncbi:MAG: hypothetical protein HFF73_00275 [Oscillospiraceae bacterium]|nr:hypothetical protein [Oscillospiraceae bacterium]